MLRFLSVSAVLLTALSLALPAPAAPPKKVAVGDAAPEISGNDLDGQAMRLSDFKGKVVVLEFWASWCPDCRKMLPYDKTLSEHMSGKSFALLGVNSDKSKNDAQACLKDSGLSSFRCWSRSDVKPAAYGANEIPTYFVIDQQGIIRAIVSGGEPKATEKAIDHAVHDLLGKGKKK